ncbi:MAG TPA: hypothetical protein VM124_00895 [Candidatus Limnocylindrales bacterium]|nr:hypothetical protein [Candidatus Limnocylindrales bacterium]
MENKNHINLSLKQHWFLLIPVIATALSLFLAVSLPVMRLSVSGICDNVQGWDGLGCVISGQYIGLIIFSVLFILMSIVLLKRLVIASRSMAALITVPVAVFVLAVVLSNGLYYATPDFPTNLLGHIYLILFGSIAISAMLFLFIMMFSFTDRLSRTASLILCVLLVPGIYSLVRLTSANIRSSQYIQEQKGALEKDLSFTVYQPTYAPNGYTLDTGPNNPGFQPGIYLYGHGGKGDIFEPSHYVFRYFYPLSAFNKPNDPNLPSADYDPPAEYEIFEYEFSSDYNPPHDCGGTVSIINAGGSTFPELDAYGEQIRPCGLIGHSTAGCDVYFEERATSRYSTGLFGYCKIGSTVVAIVAKSTFTDNKSLPAQKAEMIKIFDSLQALTPQQLEENALRGAENRK